MASNTLTQGELLAARMTARQAVPRNLSTTPPRNLSVVRHAGAPTNDAGLKFERASGTGGTVMQLQTLARELQAAARVTEGLTARAGESYSYDWGDGTVEDVVSTSHTHIYEEAGTYTVTVTNPEGENASSSVTVPGVDTFTVRAAPSAEDPMIAVVSLLVGVSPFTVDVGDGSTSIEVTTTEFDYAYDAEGIYTISATDSAGGTGTTSFEAVSDEPEVLEITEPEDGTVTDDPLYPIYGSGAVPNAEVELWSSDRDPATGEPNATTTADGVGDFSFEGSTPAVYGATTWTVISGGYTSDPVTVTVEEPDVPEEEDADEPEEDQVDAPWRSFVTHAAFDEYMTDNDLSPPVGWENTLIAEKKEWLDENG